MGERIRYLGGNLEIESDERGTAATATLPPVEEKVAEAKELVCCLADTACEDRVAEGSRQNPGRTKLAH